MKKIYLITAGITVVILIIVFILVTRKKTIINQISNSPFPTSIPRQELNQKNNPPFDISTTTPVETEDFKLQYSPKLNQIIVEKKTLQAEKKFVNWANQNQLKLLVKNPNLVLFVDQGKNPDDFNPMLEFLNIFMNIGSGVYSPNKSQSLNLPVSQFPNQLSPTSYPLSPTTFFTYFAQCNGYGNLSLPDGCSLCQAGCGPTTVAMIAASYLGVNYNPKTIVDMYQSKGYVLGCTGSRFSDAKRLLQDLGLKTTDYLIYNLETAEQVVPELKKYLDAGWTFFTLANFNTNGGSHFFWITDIDNQGNIFAYDPYYGRYEVPYRENSRYPYPFYKLAFGVKKI